MLGMNALILLLLLACMGSFLSATSFLLADGRSWGSFWPRPVVFVVVVPVASSI